MDIVLRSLTCFRLRTFLVLPLTIIQNLNHVLFQGSICHWFGVIVLQRSYTAEGGERKREGERKRVRGS